MPYPKKNKESRFWCKVRKTAGCWFWIAARFQQGYGVYADGDTVPEMSAVIPEGT